MCTKKPRLWPAYVIIGIQIVALALTVTPELNNLVRFIFMALGPLVCLLLFLAWLLFASRLRWQERLTIAFGAVALGVAAGPIAHESMPSAMWAYGGPLTILLVVVGLSVCKSWKPASRSAFTLFLVACGWGIFAMGRLEGFDGSYWPEFLWRWQPTHEERLMVREQAEPYEGIEAEFELSATDWPGFRGPNQDSRVKALRVRSDWERTPPSELWRIPVGPAWSSFACVSGRLFTQEQRGEDEAIICYDAETGQTIWRHTCETRFTEVVSGAGPRATPTFADGRLYAMGAKATLNCLDAATGQVIWDRDLMSEIGAEVPMSGFSGSPLVTHDLVIVYADGRDGHGLVAFDSSTGDPVWHVAAGGMNYSSAQLATIAGVPLVLFGSETRLQAIEPATGDVLWKFTPSGWKGGSMVQPQPIGDGRVIVPLGDGIGVARIDIDLEEGDWKVTERWTSRYLKPSFNDFVYYDGHLYGFDQSIFACVDAETGKRKWKQGRYGSGQVLLLETSALLLVTCETGDVVLLAADPTNHRELARISALAGKTWNHPIVAGDRLFLRNGQEAACFQLPIEPESDG